MFLCRTISIFFFLFSMVPLALFHKNISQDNLNNNTTAVVIYHNTPNRPLTSKHRPINGTESVPGNCSENKNDYNISTCGNDPLLEDDEYGAIIEKFINEMEEFWLEIKGRIFKQKSKKITPGKWWHERHESKYKAMKAKFYKDIPATLPQKIIDVINEYEMRYNELMWREIEHELNLINEANSDEYINDTPFTEDASVGIKQEGNKTHKSSNDLINVDKCTKKNFNDLLFEAKVSKTESYSNNDYDE